MTKIIPTSIYELLLFTLVHNLKDLTYSKILRVFSSFGIYSEDATMIIIKKLKDGDIIYKGNVGTDYETILRTIINLPKINYPITLSIKEAIEIFNNLNLKFPSDYLNFFNKLAKNQPEFVALSSSKLGEAPNLITFKQIFVDNLTFHPNNNWDLK